MYPVFKFQVKTKDAKVILGEGNTTEDLQELFIQAERIKAFLHLRKRSPIIKKLLAIDNLFEDIKFRCQNANSKIELLERSKLTIEKTNDEVYSKIIQRINSVAEQTGVVKTERIHTKAELFEAINKEIEIMENTSQAKIKQLTEQLTLIKKQYRDSYSRCMELEQEKSQEKVLCDKGTQLQLENIMNF